MRHPEFQDSHHYRRDQNSLKTTPSIWQRLSRVMEVIIIILLILGLAKLLNPEFKKQKQLEADLEHLTAIKLQKSAQAERLRKEHTSLSDRNYLEAVARDRLNLQRDGEYVIHIER